MSLYDLQHGAWITIGRCVRALSRKSPFESLEPRGRPSGYFLFTAAGCGSPGEQGRCQPRFPGGEAKKSRFQKRFDMSADASVTCRRGGPGMSSLQGPSMALPLLVQPFIAAHAGKERGCPRWTTVRRRAPSSLCLTRGDPKCSVRVVHIEPHSCRSSSSPFWRHSRRNPKPHLAPEVGSGSPRR